MAFEISLKTLIESGAHFGHQARRWNPKMKPYIYGVNDGVHIFDLIKTKAKLEEALDALRKAHKDGKKIVFIGTKKQVKDKIKEVALATTSFYVNERFLGGTLTNFEQIKRSITKLADMKKKMQEGGYKAYTKKERLLIDREIQRLDRFFGGIAQMEKTPDLMIIVDTRRERGAVREALAMGIETIGIIDSNSDPTQVDYPIPMNDDANKALDYVLDLMKDVLLGKKVKEVKKDKEVKPKTESTNKTAAKKVKAIKNEKSKTKTKRAVKSKTSKKKSVKSKTKKK